MQSSEKLLLFCSSFSYSSVVVYQITEFIGIRDVEGDLRQIISEANARKTLPHVRDRAERAVASILMITDQESLVRAIDEVLSALLIATEIVSSPKLIVCCLGILQKIAASGAIRGETFLHIVTVLCKSAAALITIHASSSGSGIQSEIDLAELRCLQTLHLLQVADLGRSFLDEIALSQVIGMCVNLATNPASSPTVTQSAHGAIAQLHLFVLETTLAEYSRRTYHDDKEPSRSPGDLMFNSVGEIQGVYKVGNELISDLGCDFLKPLFSFFHDLVTMASPSVTKHVACSLFGSGRVKAQLAIDMLSHHGTVSWKLSPLVLVVAQYLLPVISRTIAAYLEGSAGEVSLSHFRQLMKLFVVLAKNETLYGATWREVNQVLIQLHNFLDEDGWSGEVNVGFNRILVTEICTLSIAGNAHVLSQLMGGSMDRTQVGGNPCGGDSPVKRVRTILDSVCMHLHSIAKEQSWSSLEKFGIKSINDGSGANRFTLLMSSSQDLDDQKNAEIAMYIDFILTLIDTTYKCHPPSSSFGGAGISVLSCLVLAITESPGPPAPGILVGLEKLLVILSRSNQTEGMHACIMAVLKLKPPTPGINKFILNMFQRMSSDPLILDNVSLDMWRQIIRQFEIISATPPTAAMSSDELTVQEIAIDTFFSSPASDLAVTKFVAALCDPSAASVWMFERLAQLLASPVSNAYLAERLWTKHIHLDASSRDKKLVPAAHALVRSLVVKFPSAPLVPIVLTDSIALIPGDPVAAVTSLVSIVESCGHLLTVEGWTSVVSAAHACGQRSSVLASILRICEMAIDDYSVGHELPRIIELLEVVVSCESLPSTSAFRAIALCHQAGAAAAPSLSESFFMTACTDSRAEVRNCALKTIASGVGLGAVVLGICERVVSIAENPPAPPPSQLAVEIVHHSRDTEEKRWSESIVLSLQALVKESGRNVNCFKALIPRVVDLIECTLFSSAMTDEVICASSKCYFDLWKHQGFTPAMLGPIKRDTAGKFSRVTPMLVTAIFRPTALPSVPEPPVEEALFECVASIFDSSDVLVDNSVPFRPVDGREVEAYRPFIQWSSDSRYEPIPTEVSPLFLSSILSCLHVFTAEHVSSLFLTGEVVFDNSLRLAMAAKALAHLAHRPRSWSVNECVLLLARSRNGSPGIAATGIWKLACQILLNDPRLLDQCTGDDVIDYMHFFSVADRSACVQQQLAGDVSSFRTAIFFTVLANRLGLLVGEDKKSSLGEIAMSIFSRRDDDEIFQFISLLPEHAEEAVDDEKNSLVGYMTKLITGPEKESSICSLIELLTNSSNHQLRDELVALVWAPLVTHLIPSDSRRVREALSRLLNIIGPKI